MIEIDFVLMTERVDSAEESTLFNYVEMSLLV